MERRSFFQTTSLAAMAGILPAHAMLPSTPSKQSRIKLSVSSYSYWHFKGEKFPIEKVIDEAASMGLDGIDVLHRQMEGEDNAYLQKIKKHAFLNGIALTCLSIHQGFVTPDKAELKTQLDKDFAGTPYMFISSVAQQGLSELKDKLWQMLNVEV